MTPRTLHTRWPIGMESPPPRPASAVRRYFAAALFPSACLSMLLAVLPAGAQDGQASMTVYRCTDGRGQLVALRDSPCLPGEHQEATQMRRPRDPPPRTVSTEPSPATAPASASTTTHEVRVVNVPAPPPLYECTAPDGSTYLSETDRVNERWVPLWTLGYPVGPGPRPPPGNSAPPVRPAGAIPTGGGGRPGVIAPAGTWVRDSCARLSQDEVCSRMSDRRYEILRIYHAAMPSQRQELDREQRQIDTHMANYCN